MPSSIVARALLRDAATRVLPSSLSRCGRVAASARFGSACGDGGGGCTVRRQRPRLPLPPSSPPPSPRGVLGDRHRRRCRPLSTAAEDAGADDGAGGEPTTNRRKTSQVKISEVLKRKHTLRWVEPVISADATVREAIALCIDRRLNGMMVVDRCPDAAGERRRRDGSVVTLELRQKCVGLLTSRDILRMMADGIAKGLPPDEILGGRISEQMTPISQVIYGRPDETIGMCRAIMAKLGIKCLPILSDGRVEGILAGRDFSDFYFDAKDLGGKKNYLRDVSVRVGLTTDTSMAEPPVFVRQPLNHAPLRLEVGVAELPHPFKKKDGIGTSRRNFGPRDLAMDPDLSEDAHFLAEVEPPPDESGTPQRLLYMGVADGVGSWREYGVDPREFSRKLMGECEAVLGEAAAAPPRATVSPAELLGRAYERTREANVIGSSTACVALFDAVRHQLHFSNIGDSGIIVLRHIDSDVASALQRNRTTPRAERVSDLRVAFVSQQQLKSFNHPFQMGWTGEETGTGDGGGSSSFRRASDSCTSSVHVLRGDIILMATDGLFDNVDIEDIASVALRWEAGAGTAGAGVNGIRAIPKLAEELCERARENSLNNEIDSPFALLAKENDIMWSGGMPDDCTVIAMHVVG